MINIEITFRDKRFELNHPAYTPFKFDGEKYIAELHYQEMITFLENTFIKINETKIELNKIFSII